MGSTTKNLYHRPRVCLVGDHEHPDFSDAAVLLRSDAEIVSDRDIGVCPELIVAAHSRLGLVDIRRVEQIRSAAPLAGVVALLGTWCEGDGRTGPPLPGMRKLYWHQFAPWWRRQLALRAAGCCPEWARGDTSFTVPAGSKNVKHTTRQLISNGVVVLATPHWESADAIADVLQPAGFATVWQPRGRIASAVRGIAAGIWDGGQLDNREATDLQEFCCRLRREAAPVIALLDYPRRDLCEVAQETGAAAVLGKPWVNVDLVTLIQEATSKIASVSAA